MNDPVIKYCKRCYALDHYEAQCATILPAKVVRHITVQGAGKVAQLKPKKKTKR